MNYAAIIDQDQWLCRVVPHSDIYPLHVEPPDTAVALTEVEASVLSVPMAGRWKREGETFTPYMDADNAAIRDAQIRSERSQLLKSSDWTQLPDVPLATKEAWATYRQALRDITDQQGYPLLVTWPVAPDAQLL
jgi:hypothetical protein